MTTTAESDDDVTREYQRRLDARRAALARRERACLRVSRLRLAIVAAAAAILIIGGFRAANWVLVPIAAFVAAVIWHVRLFNARDRAASAVAFYERRLAHVKGEWVGRGHGGERFHPRNHPYAADLNIFGRGSLFELLSTARTHDGEETLAQWLLAPASPDVVRARQDAVRELAPRLDLRESIAVMGDVVRAHVDASRLRSWAAAPVRLRGTGTRVVLALLVAALLTAIVWWSVFGTFVRGIAALIVVQAVVGLWFKTRVHEVSHAVDEASHDLDVLAGFLRVLEGESFASPLLRRLQDTVTGSARAPSREIAHLSQVVALLSSRENLLFRGPAAFVMWTTQWAFAVDAWRARVGARVSSWLDAVGEIEALLAFATLAFEHPEYVYPEFIDGPPMLVGAGVAHPVLPVGAVANDIALGDGPVRLFIVSGSNMSGKSTWLRTIGANVVLAEAGAPVRATRFRLSPLHVGAAINIQDSLADGRSKFFAEIRQIAEVVTLAAAYDGRVLFLLDEILGGTNSHDRRIGAEALLSGLIGRGAIGLATTHDLAIGEIADRLAPAAANVHFEDRFEDEVLKFDYRIRPGIVQTSNALALMRSIGLDV